MNSDGMTEFPRREFTESKVPYQACIYAASIILPLIAVAMVGRVLPDFPAKAPVGVLAWCLIAATCLVLMRRALSRMDFTTPVVILDANAVTFLQPRTRVLSWSSILKVRFRESGQYRTVKTFIFELENGGELEFTSSWIAGMSARQLFDLITIYHRKFGPSVPVFTGYDSAGWTGE